MGELGRRYYTALQRKVGGKQCRWRSLFQSPQHPYTEALLSAVPVPDPTVLCAFDRRVLLTHGDELCLSDTAYQAFRAQVRGDAWRAAQASAIDALQAFHAKDPLKSGMARETLRAAVARDMTPEAFRELLNELAANAEVGLAGDRVARTDHEAVE